MENFRIELLLPGSVRADGRDVRAGLNIAGAQERMPRSSGGYDQPCLARDFGRRGGHQNLDPRKQTLQLAAAFDNPPRCSSPNPDAFQIEDLRMHPRLQSRLDAAAEDSDRVF